VGVGVAGASGRVGGLPRALATDAPPQVDLQLPGALMGVKVREVGIEDLRAPVEREVLEVQEALRDVVGKRHPMLLAAAEQIFGAGGKRVRPLICLLVARATTDASRPLCSEHNRLAMISEMIHTASLVHDDVLDSAELRRGETTVHGKFGTRVAVLAGDFLFAQSSWFLANLENMEVIKLISQVIADFADGEISQAAALFNTDLSVQDYLDKSHYKTASLIAASCRSSAVFSGCSTEEKEAMYEYGKRLGLAFQVVDDILDFTQSTEQLGKPQGQDLATGNLTAPAIYAMSKSPELVGLVKGRFAKEGDLARAMGIISEEKGIEAAMMLAQGEGMAAKRAIEWLPESEAKTALYNMVDYVLSRLS